MSISPGVVMRLGRVAVTYVRPESIYEVNR